MIGVTTALVGFIFVCVIFPHLVKNRPQFYAALAFVCAAILLDGVPIAGLHPFTYAIGSLLQVGAILLLFLSAGGLTWRQLANDMSSAIEVIRRGGEKEVIVPLTGERPRPRAERSEPARERTVIVDPVVKAASPDEKIPLV